MKLAEAAKLFKALSSEQRLKVLQIIREMSGGERGCAGATKAFTRCCEELKLSPSTVSHHFKELEGAGIITTERRGQCCCCQVDDRLWTRLKEFLK
jgi:ArsR family transcriptional regulator, arsenate/arsenite/antimonite-responsive transcriptional repressor